MYIYSETVEHGWGELDKDADNVEEATSRLALCNMDWDRIQAADLMILFNSFLPADGFIKSITVSLKKYTFNYNKSVVHYIYVDLSF